MIVSEKGVCVMAVYLDILILTNLFVTYFLLLSTKVILHRKASKKRMLLASLAGGMSAGILLFPALHPAVSALVKLVVSVVICILAFGVCSWRFLVRNTIGFYSISFIYAGLMMALWYFLTPLGMQFRNGVAYFNLSATMLLGSTIVAYVVIQLISHLLKKTPQPKQILDVQICCDGRAVLLKAFLDTGNRVSDVITGFPVAFCELASIRDLMPEEVFAAFQQGKPEMLHSSVWKKRIRMIPVSAVVGEGVAVGFKPEYLLIEIAGKQVKKQAIVAVSNQKLSGGEFSMLIGELMLQH